MSGRNSQNVQIMKFMRKHGSITSLQAFKHLKCLRLASRIWDLRKRHDILDITVHRNGKHYSKYYIA